LKSSEEIALSCARPCRSAEVTNLQGFEEKLRRDNVFTCTGGIQSVELAEKRS
jgi:hypothetical protein